MKHMHQKPKKFHLNDFHGKQAMLPVNRKFIETHGGIHDFGSKVENFLTSESFNISSAILGRKLH